MIVEEKNKRLSTRFLMPDGEWKYLVITNDGDREKYYCNGVLTGDFETKEVNQLNTEVGVENKFDTLKDRYDFVGDGGIKNKSIKDRVVNYFGEPNNIGHCGGPDSRVKLEDSGMCNSSTVILEQSEEMYKKWLKDHNLDKVKDYTEEQKEYIEKEQIKMSNGETKQGNITLKGVPENTPSLQNVLICLFAEVECNEKLASKIMEKTMLLGGEQFISGPETDEQTPFVSYLDSLETLKQKIHSNNIMLENILKEITKIL
jgi:hypothetical protein